MATTPDRVTLATRTHQGRRPYNQDVVLAEEVFLKSGARGHLLIVADGMGGAAAGEVASRVAAHTLRNTLVDWVKRNDIDPSSAKTGLRLGYRAAHEAVQQEAAKDPARQGMGTTLVAALVWADHYVVANVGDSRAYVIDSGDITQITKDHSAVQEMIDRGVIQPEHRATAPMAHALTRALGDSPEPPEVDVFPRDGAYSLHPGQILLLCSDGLENGVDDDAIHGLVCGAPNLEDTAEALVRAAWHGGSRDNISVALVERGHLQRRPGKASLPPPISRAKPRTRRRRPSSIPALVLFLVAAGLGAATWKVWHTTQTEQLVPSPPLSKEDQEGSTVLPPLEKGDRGGFPSPMDGDFGPDTAFAQFDSAAPESSTAATVAPPPLQKGDEGGFPSPTSQEDRPRLRRAPEAPARPPSPKPQAPTPVPITDPTSAPTAGTAVTEPTRTPPLTLEGDEGTTQPSPPLPKGDEGGFPSPLPEAALPGEPGVEPPTSPARMLPDSVAPARPDSPSATSPIDPTTSAPADAAQPPAEPPEPAPSTEANPNP
ncbi:protein phosphatase 2C domain-containing protein [Candidatus Fermentibacteria bacterium]|nr:protein phosphatase 2C domain-containing protein [Candidatus Fermentibacteria bacterium]